MEIRRTQALEAVIAAMGIGEEELKEWFESRGNKKDSFVLTALPLVYRHENEFTVEDGLNLNRLTELWGVQLLSGELVALKCGLANSVASISHKDVKKFASEMKFEGKTGSLPSKDILNKFWGGLEKVEFEATVKILKQHKIDIDGYRGYIWCAERHNMGHMYCFNLQHGSAGVKKDFDANIIRVAVKF